MDKKKILIVDNDRDLVEIIKIRLKENGYDVLEAFDGDQGIEVAKEESPDLVLMDIMMPRKHGYAAFGELKADEETKSIPVIIMSSKNEMKVFFESEDICDFITKPFDGKDLIKHIEKALG